MDFLYTILLHKMNFVCDLLSNIHQYRKPRHTTMYQNISSLVCHISNCLHLSRECS